MSGPSTYNPKSGIAKWIDSRLPLPPYEFISDTKIRIG